jgi:hypothetical protein
VRVSSGATRPEGDTDAVLTDRRTGLVLRGAGTAPHRARPKGDDAGVEELFARASTDDENHGIGIGTRLAVALFALFAAYAVVLAFVARGAESTWGDWAAGGFGCAAVVALGWWRRYPGASLLVALAGAFVLPASILPANWGATSEVRVVARAASLWLAHGTPYLATNQLASWRSYDPYLPGMSLFGLPHAVGLPGALGDPLVWLALATIGALVAACRIADPGGAPACSRCRRQALLRTLLLVACPVFALPMALGVTDPPVIALMCLGLAWTARPSDSVPGQAANGSRSFDHGLDAEGRRLERPGRPPLGGIAIGAACALKATAWPALPIIAALVAVRDGKRAATRFVSGSLATFLVLLVVTAPALFVHPGAFWENIVAYPLGISRRPTQAASPLPGHLLASAGSIGHVAAIGLLVAVVVALGASLVVRPPRDVAQASLRLAVTLTAMFVLAPDARFGYFAYPLAIMFWLVLAVLVRRRPRLPSDRVRSVAKPLFRRARTTRGLPTRTMFGQREPV